MDATPTQLRLGKVETLRSTATLLLVRAHHNSMKEQVRLATRDLEEARTWLTIKIEDQPAILNLVDAVLYLARVRLSLVEETLKAHGPEAALHE